MSDGGQNSLPVSDSRNTPAAHGSKSSRHNFSGTGGAYREALPNNGRCPTGTVPSNFPKAKKGGSKPPFRMNHPEIETLIGTIPIADLDFEAVEMAARRQSLRLAARAVNNGSHGHQRLWDRNCPCPCGWLRPLSLPSLKDLTKAVLGPLHLHRA